MNFLLPRMLPGNPIGYLTGMDEAGLSPEQYAYYYDALHLGDSLPVQFGFYLKSILDGTLGFSFKKNAAVSVLIGGRLKYTLLITLPAVVLSAVLGLVWGLESGLKQNSAFDRVSSAVNIAVNAVPTFALSLVLITLFCFRSRLLPYTGLSSVGMSPGTPGFLADRILHLILPVGSLTIATLPSRYLLIRNNVRAVADEKYLLYARARGLSKRTVKYRYVFRNICAPFINMVGLSVSQCVGGSLVIENIFSIQGMGTLLTDAVHSLDYPLMQGILFVITAIMALSIIISDILCILLDPKLRKGAAHE